jgi:hypothetical protein
MELRVSPVTQAEFDRLATFVAVAEELSMEPFVSDDNHERLFQSKNTDGSQAFMGEFCHPAFLKSAILRVCTALAMSARTAMRVRNPDRLPVGINR